MSLHEALLPELGSLGPVAVKVQLMERSGQMVSDLSAKDNLRRRHACGWIWSISMDQESTSKFVTIQGAIWLKIVSHHPFATFDGNFRTFIRLRIVRGTYPLSDTPTFAKGVRLRGCKDGSSI